jgi:hypothetical protein
LRPGASAALKKPTKSAVNNAKAKTQKTPAKSKTATPPRRSAKSRKSVRQAAARKPATRTRAQKKAAADLDNLGDLPRSYGEDRMFVVAQEPHWLFCYWDDALTEGVKGTILLRHSREGVDRPEAEVPVPAETNSWYLAVQEADAGYLVELGSYHGTRWRTLVRSGAVLTPRDSVTGFGQPVFVNLPFQATSQKLGEKIHSARRQGESLSDALVRLERRGELPVDRLAPTSAALSRRGTMSRGPSSWSGGRQHS